MSTKKVLIGSIAGALLFTGGMMVGSNNALAKKATEVIRVNFANIKLIVNGKEIQTKAEPFSYNGNVYVPAATLANMFGIGQTWDSGIPAVRFESADRVSSDPRFMGMSGHESYPHPLDYVYALRPGLEKVVNNVSNKEVTVPKMETTGTLTPISRIVHTNIFYMVETNSQGTFLSGYQIDKVKFSISKLFSSPIDPVKGEITYNEATRDFTEEIFDEFKLVGVKFYWIDYDNKIIKRNELLTQQ